MAPVNVYGNCLYMQKADCMPN